MPGAKDMNMRKRVTLKEIAAATGFTANTVSKALRGSPDISGPTRARIREAADRMGYVANNMAGALRSGFTNTIALVVPDISNPFFSIVAKEVDEAAQRSGHAVIILNTEEDADREERVIRVALSKNVDGMLIFPTQHDTGGLKLLKNAGVPFVLMGRRFDDFRADSIVFDDRRGGYLATDYLLKKGKRRVLLVNAPLHIYGARERLAGYAQALDEHGIDPDGQPRLNLDGSLRHARERLTQAVCAGLEMDAVFAFSDMLALECLCALQDLGLSEDVEVVGFDDILSTLMLPIPLTTVHTETGALARGAFELLLRRIAGDWDGYPASDVLPVTLTVRN